MGPGTVCDRWVASVGIFYFGLDVGRMEWTVGRRLMVSWRLHSFLETARIVMLHTLVSFSFFLLDGSICIDRFILFNPFPWSHKRRTEPIYSFFLPRCRKKMKRVERCGTLESQQQQAANQSGQQHQQHQPRSSSHANIPLSQSSDRSIHRSDTILTHQPSHSPSAFSQPQPQPHPQSHSQSTRDRDASSSSSHTQSNIRSSLSNLHPSSSISAQNSVPSTYSSSYQIFR